MAECLIGLGSNLGDRAAQLEQACRLLCGHPQILNRGRSTFHATAPVGGPAGQKMFLNAVLRITTSLSARELLAVVANVEQQLGRQRRERWEARAIDIDVLLYDQRVEETDELVLPHPRMAVRRFVLGPACEVAGDMIHPTTGWTIAELLRRLDESPHYVAIAGIDAAQTTSLAAAAAQVTGAHLVLDPAPPSEPGRQPEAETQLAERELQTIAARLEQLVGLAARESTSGGDWHVCNFWLPQSFAAARAWLHDPARGQVIQACAAAVQQMPIPHCVLFPGAPSTGIVPASGHEQRADPLTPRPHDLAALAQQLLLQLAQPGQGPVLRIPGGDSRLALTELIAAIDAMR